jgi:hypothetical protein
VDYRIDHVQIRSGLSNWSRSDTDSGLSNWSLSDTDRELLNWSRSDTDSGLSNWSLSDTDRELSNWSRSDTDSGLSNWSLSDTDRELSNWSHSDTFNYMSGEYSVWSTLSYRWCLLLKVFLWTVLLVHVDKFSKFIWYKCKQSSDFKIHIMSYIKF